MPTYTHAQQASRCNPTKTCEHTEKYQNKYFFVIYVIKTIYSFLPNSILTATGPCKPAIENELTVAINDKILI